MNSLFYNFPENTAPTLVQAAGEAIDGERVLADATDGGGQVVDLLLHDSSYGAFGFRHVYSSVVGTTSSLRCDARVRS